MAMLHYVDDRPITLTEQGRWEQGGELLHPKVASLFGAHIVPISVDGFEVQLGRQRQVVDVRDVGYFVRSLKIERDGRGFIEKLVAHLSDGQEEVLDPATFEQRDDGVFYVRIVRHGYRTRCRLTSSQYHELALEAEERSDVPDEFQIEIAGSLWRFGKPMGPVNLEIS